MSVPTVEVKIYIRLFRTKMQIQYKREVKYIHTYHQCPVYHENSVFYNDVVDVDFVFVFFILDSRLCSQQ